MKILYVLGPAGTFGHHAAVTARDNLLNPFAGYDLVFVDRQPEIFGLLAQDKNPGSRGIVAIENSIHGLVGETFGQWVKADPNPVSIVGEIFLPIHHCLLTRPEVAVDDVVTVFSHEVALAQCSSFLSSSGFVTQRSPSTAFSAKMVSDSDEPIAAIASGFAAGLYGLTVRQRDIANDSENMTRFHVLAATEKVQPTGQDKTALLFRIPDDVGSLVRVLGLIADCGRNMSSIHSQACGSMGKYVFYCEIDCHSEDETGKRLFDQIAKVTDSFQILGSYPQAQNQNRP